MSAEAMGFGPVEYVHHQWPADPRRSAEVRAAMRGWLLSLNLTQDQSGDILLAVSEAVDNALQHAYPADASGPIEIVLWTEPGMLCIEVADRGAWREPKGGEVGMGLALMRSLVESAIIRYGPSGTRVLLRHPLPPGSPVIG